MAVAVGNFNGFIAAIITKPLCDRDKPLFTASASFEEPDMGEFEDDLTQIGKRPTVLVLSNIITNLYFKKAMYVGGSAAVDPMPESQ